MDRKKRLKELLIPAAVAVLSAVAAILATHEIAFLTQAEQFVADLRIAGFMPPQPQDPDIVIAAINEDTLKLFPYRSPVDRLFLSNLLKALDAREPRAIGMDVLFDQPTEPAKDAALADTIAHMKTPIAISYTNNPEIVDQKQRAFLDKFVPPDDRVAAELAEDSLDIARWISPRMREDNGQYLIGFARGVLAKIGIATPDTEPEMVWHGRPNAQTTPFKIFPSHLIPVIPPAWIKGKIVLIGAVESLVDRHRTAFSSIYGGNVGDLPGIEIHAHAIWQLLDRVPPRNLGEWSEIALVLVIAVVGAALGGLQMSVVKRISYGFGALALLWLGGFGLFRLTGVSVVLISPSIALGLSQWGTDMVKGRQSRRQREYIQSVFGRFVAPQVVEKLVANPGKLTLEGEAREMTFLFTDIEGFTTLSEDLAKREDKHVLANLLNAYLDGVCAAILSLEGTIDKFIGDAVFAIFNAPADQPDHAERAVKCALAIDRFSQAFRAEQAAKGIRLGVTRIGVHTGPAVVGNFGSHSKMQYTALGDSVNTASRLEGVNKYFGTRICISESTRALVPEVIFRPIHVIVPKGKEEPLGIYEPLDEERANSPFMMKYFEACELAERQDPRALKLFKELQAEAPADKCVEIYIERLNESEYGPMVMHDK